MSHGRTTPAPASAARLLAFQVLTDVERGRALSERLARVDVETLDTRERGFLHELVLGSLRLRGRLDHALQPRLDRPLGQVDADVRRLLRLAAHEILHLRVPDRAAVSQAVELARVVAPRAGGFVNAVLRALAREGAPPAPDRRREALAWLVQVGSLPAWLAARWLHALGAELACARAEAMAQTPPVGLRLTPASGDTHARATAAGLELSALPVPGAWRLASGDTTALQRDGLIYVQDMGSQLVAHLAADGGTPLLDACAAPGGKTLLAHERLGADACVVALERAPRRLGALRGLLRTFHAEDVHVVSGDGLRPPFRAGFRCVLLDAPCSGLGTLARNPDLRWRLGPEEPVRQAARQARLLHALADLLGPGGRLVYSVCSLEPEETEGVVAPFLAARRDFEIDTELPAWTRPFADGPWLRTLPERDGGDGFFAAVLRRRA